MYLKPIRMCVVMSCKCSPAGEALKYTIIAFKLLFKLKKKQNYSPLNRACNSCKHNKLYTGNVKFLCNNRNSYLFKKKI